MKLNNQETVGTTVQDVVPHNKARTSLTIFNVGPVTAYIGGDDQLTSGNGLPLPAGIGYSFLKELGDDPRLNYWLITGAATADIRWFEMSLEEVE